uniref:MD-2-related lipid-recognition domain-containing protein n=1 Tax=Anopheles funestus TaxID=62324 RepID=A0A4Y0BQL1_ANOFN
MQCRIHLVIVLKIALLSCHGQAFGVEISLESIEQNLGYDILLSDVRARKYNRTTTVANGTMHMYKELSNDYEHSLDMFYSRLGNQQFNHLPMKLPTAGLCDFVDHIYKNYPGYMSYFVNGPQKGECPIRKRDIHVIDTEFPSEVVPPILVRNGLYKAVIRGYLHGKEVLRYTVIVKAMDG